MINVDDRILKLVNQNEFWLLAILAKRLNENKMCWPSNRMLCKETGWHIEKLQKIKKSLADKGMLKTFDRFHAEGGRGSNRYQITTNLIGVFITLEDVGPLQEAEDRSSEKPHAGKTDSNEKTDIQGTIGNYEKHPPENPTDKEVLTKEVLTTKKYIGVDEKKKAFQKTIAPYVKTFTPETCNAFYLYWSEVTRDGKRLKWELEKTWEVKLRLTRWKKNEQENPKGGRGFQNSGHNQPTAPMREGTNNQAILDEMYKGTQFERK